MALKRSICNDLESFGSEERLETDGTLAAVIMYKEHGTKTINFRWFRFIELGRTALAPSIRDDFESFGSERRLETDGAFIVVMICK